MFRTEDNYSHDMVKKEKLMNDFRKDEFPKQVKLSVRSAGDAFLDDSLDANDVGYLNVGAQQVRPAAERATHLLQHVPDPRDQLQPFQDIKEGVISDPISRCSICYLVYLGVSCKNSDQNFKN